MTPAELRRRAAQARKKGPMRAVAIWPDEADASAAALPNWISVQDRLPDADILVIVATDDDEVFPGFIDADTWRDASGWPISAAVLHWTDFPPPPTRRQS